jgi:xylulose-5-phosphate/fructose-6-phosphate phosphoketolase
MVRRVPRCREVRPGIIYLRDNPLLRKPLRTEHVKWRLLGHWGSDPGMSLVYLHRNRLIDKYDLDVIFFAGPGTAGQPSSPTRA